MSLLAKSASVSPMTPDPLQRRAVNALIKKATTLLSQYVQEGRTRTDLLKRTAVVVVDLRSHFALDDGRTDWSGRSQGYRQVISAIYQAAGIRPEYLDTVQSALRYHVGNLIRERASDDDLEAVGLTLTSPKERIGKNRSVVAAIAGSVGEVMRDVNRILASVEVLMGYLIEDQLAALLGADAVAADMSLSSIEVRARLLRLAMPRTEG